MGETFVRDGIVNFKGLFLIPCGAAIVAALAMAIFFRPPEKSTIDGTGRSAPAH